MPFHFLFQQILRHARGNSTKVIFLITDGYSNGGDPRPIAASLREFGVEIFTFGIWQGNTRELNDMASHPKEDHCYLLHSFTEFEALARRALHEGINLRSPTGSTGLNIKHCLATAFRVVQIPFFFLIFPPTF